VPAGLGSLLASWPHPAEAIRFRLDVARRGLDALPEPPPLILGVADDPAAAAGMLRRSEIDRLLNPGDPS
jgi:hypothetical protein